MKNTCVALFLFLATYTCTFGQDQMVLNDSTKIKCKVDEISRDEISYRLWADLQGPRKRIHKRKVSYIIFENGMRQTFSQHERVRHRFMYRNYISAYNPFAHEVANMGQAGKAFAGGHQLSFYLNRRKTVSLGISGYGAVAESFDLTNEIVSIDYFALGVNLKSDYHWYQWKEGSMYSGLGLGYVEQEYFYSSDFSNPRIPNRTSRRGIGYQIDMLGIEFSPLKHFGIYAELGLGNEGVFQIGFQLHG